MEYYVRGIMMEDGQGSKKTTVNMAIRKIQYAPTRPGRQPSTTVRKDFMFSPGELELEGTLDKYSFYSHMS